jgi:predicted glycoside hydrolase/deacetylase ChbG (UPF0249 family)
VRTLIVNADDFGRSGAINRGVVRAFEEGVVTSASLMVRHGAAAQAAEYARAHPELGVGLHLDLGEWAVSEADGWEALYEVVDVADADAVAVEIERQLDTFERLVGDRPTHLDSHQHIHRTEPVRTLLGERAAALGVPLRGVTPGIEYRGEFYGRDEHGMPIPGALDPERFVEVVRALPPGVTELGCHPGEVDPGDAAYGRERAEELATLCDPRVRAAIVEAGVVLSSFRGVP